MIKIYLLLILLIYPIFGQTHNNYIWPTDASRHMTSSFCEYRPGHYHSAIDIKTWNKEGYPIYAISDASIYRIRVSPFGYGKVIYLKLDDGNFAVYAHLQRFNEVLEEKIRSRQIKNKRYKLNWMPENLRVRQGDLLGYTGQTGIGVPHLHFEIRDPNERPMNPLRFYDQIKDTRHPVLRSLLVIPQTYKSRVNGSATEQAFSLSYIGNNTYRIDEPIQVKGPVGLAVSGFDQADGVNNAFAFYRTTLKIDEQPIFHIQYDIFDFAISNQVDVEIFYPQKAKNNIIYHKLYIDPYNKLPFYDRTLGSGIIYPNDKDINFQVEISDFSGNTTKLIGTLVSQIVESVQMQILNEENTSVFLRLNAPYNLQRLDFSTSADSQTWKPASYYEIQERELQDEYQHFLIKLLPADTSHKFIRAELKTNDKLHLVSGIINNSGKSEKINMEIENLGKYILLNFNPVDQLSGSTLIVENAANESTTLLPEFSKGKHQYILNSAFFNSPLNINLFNRDTAYIDTSLHFHKLLPDQYKQISFFDDSIRLISRPHSVYDTLLFSMNKLDTLEIENNIQLASPVYHFNSAHQVLQRGVELKIKLASIPVKPEQIGLYTIDSKDRLELIKSVIDTVENTITGPAESLGLYFAAADTTRPDLHIVYPSDYRKIKSLNLIRFTAKDEQSGVGTDANLSITIDGRFVIPEWDPEEDTITGYPHWQLASGKHIIEIKVSDMAGNQNIQHLNVIVE